MTDTWKTTFTQHIQALKRASAINKRAVFAALADAGITSLEVEFDGEGDSGGITDLWAYRDRDIIALPEVTVNVRKTEFGAKMSIRRDETLRDAIEGLCYDYLASEHGGWEIDDGSYGTFRFEVAARTIELEFNGRYTGVHTTTTAL